jgi:outer membrane lipoprotein-sorting protein
VERAIEGRACKAVLSLAVMLWASGCLRHTRVLEKPLPANVVISANAEQLVQKVDEQYDAIHSLSATVYIKASVGGARRGKVTDYTSIRGFLLMRKPDKLRVLGMLPVVETRAFDMASSGEKFTLWIPPKSKAVMGTDTVTRPSANPLENLRPSVFLDAMLVRSVGSDELVYVTNSMRLVRDRNSKHLMEEPDYELGILRQKKGSNELLPVRVIYISRTDLLPYQQDIYDDSGTLITRAQYSDYQLQGSVKFPMKITIERPQDEYTLGLTIEKLALNLPLADNQFELKVPRGTVVQHLQ